MTGNNYNKKSGQVLLIVVMLLAVVLTVVFSASFVSRTETQLTELEEEGQKALAAAEAGIEAALQSGTIADLSTLVSGGFTGSATVTTAGNTPHFVTPLVPKDRQYTFYLGSPQESGGVLNFGTITPGFNNQALRICSTSNNVALAVAIIRGTLTGGVSTIARVQRFMINPPTSTIISGNAGTTFTASAGGTGCPTGEVFQYNYLLPGTSVGATSNNLVLFVRVVGSGQGAKVGFTGGSTGTVNLPAQGRNVVSTAQSQTGVTKKIQLFQSYPQIPSEFFVTSF